MKTLEKTTDMIRINTSAVKQVIRKNGSISVEKYNADILSSKKQGTISIILDTTPKIGIAVTRKDLLKVLEISE